MDQPFSEHPAPGNPPSAQSVDDPWRRTLDLLTSMGRDLERQDPARAIDCYRQAADLARSLDQPFEEGNALARLGSVELDRGELAASETTLTRAHELLQSPAARSRATNPLTILNCLNNLGRLRFRQGRLDDALQSLRASLTRTSEVDLTPEICDVRGDTLLLLGTVYREKGETDQALRYLQDALELHRASGSESRIAQEMNGIGVLCVRLGRYTEAAEHLEGALERLRRLGIRDQTAGAANNLAVVNLHLGRLNEARHLLEESGGIFSELGDRAQAANVYTNLGLLISSQGRTEDAQEQFELALGLYRELVDRAGEATALNNLSMVALHRGRPEEAITLGRASLELRQQGGFERGLAKPLHNIGHALLELGRVDEARAQAQLALEQATRTGANEEWVEVATLLTQCHVAAGDSVSAMTLAPQALEVAERTEDPKLILLACHTLGLAHMAAGELDESKLLFARAQRLMRGWEHPHEKACVLHDEGRLLLLAGGVDAGLDRLRRAEEEFARLGNGRRRLRVLADLASAVAGRDVRQKQTIDRAGQEIAAAQGLEDFWRSLTVERSNSAAPTATLGLSPLARVVEQLQRIVASSAEPGLAGGVSRAVQLVLDGMLQPGELRDARFEARPDGLERWAELGLVSNAPASDGAEALAWNSAEIPSASGAFGLLWWQPSAGANGEALEERGRLFASLLGLAMQALGATGPNTTEGSEGDARPESFEGMVGASAPMRAVSRMIERVAPAETTVLILGESGTGKELVARAIHARSDRKQGPFVAINCPSIPRDLIESELFGHEKGAFTGAIAARPGRVETADGGTLFLDEVGDMSLAAQVKLLRFLQEREFERVGGRGTLRANVRVIAATSRDLLRMIEAQTFREDLYYRLHVVPIRMPSLRERIEDLPILVEHFLRQLAGPAGRRRRNVARNALDALRRHQWPGNVRELQNVIEYMTTVAGDADLDASHLPNDLRQRATRRETIGTGSWTDTPAAFELRPGETLDARLVQLEVALIRAALAGAEWNQSAAARRLGITESMIRNRMRQYAIERPAD